MVKGCVETDGVNIACVDYRITDPRHAVGIAIKAFCIETNGYLLTGLLESMHSRSKSIIVSVV